MSDIRNLDIEAVDSSICVKDLYRNAEALSAGANAGEYLGFYVNAAGDTDWSFVPYDGKAAVTFDPQASTYYNFHCSSITTGTNGTGFGCPPSYRHNLIDAISSWTVDGDGDLTGGVFTVPSTSGSSALTSASSVLPVIGDDYTYTYTVSSYSAATKAEIKYGGVVIYTKAAAGTYTDTITATAGTGLEVDVDVVTTADFVLDSIVIKRAA